MVKVNSFQDRVSRAACKMLDTVCFVCLILCCEYICKIRFGRTQHDEMVEGKPGERVPMHRAVGM